MFVADNVQDPVPFLLNVPVLLMIPDAVASPVPPKIAAVVSVIVPEAVAEVPALFTNEPLMTKGSAVAKPFKSTIAPLAIVVADVVPPNASLLPNCRVPALTVVLPV